MLSFPKQFAPPLTTNTRATDDTAILNARLTEPSGTLSGGRSPHCPDAVEQLGLLDDAVFEAIAGSPAALSGLKTLWPEVRSTLGARLVEESRDQYVRYALRAWRESLNGSELRDPAAAIAALDVVTLLFDE